MRSLDVYGSLLDSGKLPIAGAEERTRVVRLEEAFLLGLRRADGFDVWSVAKDLEIDYPPDWFERVDNLMNEGLVVYDGRVLRLASQGWLLATSVTEELLCPSLLSICEATR